MQKEQDPRVSQHNEGEMVFLAWQGSSPGPAGAWPPQAAPAWGLPLPGTSTSSQSAGSPRSAHPGGCPAASGFALKPLPAVNLILIALPSKVPAPRSAGSKGLSASQAVKGRGEFGNSQKKGCSVKRKRELLVFPSNVLPTFEDLAFFRMLCKQRRG